MEKLKPIVKIKIQPLKIAATKPWASGGIISKPPECSWCPLYTQGAGFCPDHVGANPKIAFLSSFPSSDDVVHIRPYSGAWGYSILNQYIYGSGFSLDNIILSNVLRCSQRWDKRLKDYKYPIGTQRTIAENNCRVYDDQHGAKNKLESGGLFTFSPNVFILTFDPKDVKKVGAYHRQILVDIEKAKKFIARGLRPLVAFGNEAAELVAPWIQGHGSVKSWRGTFFEAEWMFEKGRVGPQFNV